MQVKMTIRHYLTPIKQATTAKRKKKPDLVAHGGIGLSFQFQKLGKVQCQLWQPCV